MPRPTRASRAQHTLSAHRIAVASAAALLFCTPLHAQDALVLSGGGSRGLAHGGALIGLEQRGFLPDLVVGTSMGAVIGALYAAGYAPDSIAQLMRMEDFTTLFSPPAWITGPERAPLRPIVALRVAGNDVASATGLISDLRINRELVRLLFDAGARAGSDFDSLPRAFRAVAADLASGDAVVLDRGDLARAVRASMTVPGVFAPIFEGDRVLIDGGIASYLPVAVARHYGAQRVIAVDVLRPSAEIESTAPLAIAFRGFRHVLAQTIEDEPPPDVLVLPRIPQSLSAAYFPRNIERMLAVGAAAALEAVTEHASGARTLRRNQPPARIDTVIVERTPAAALPLLLAAFDHLAHTRYDAGAVLRAVDRVYASGPMSGVWPRVEREPDGRSRLVVRADMLPATQLAVDAGYETDVGARLRALLRHRLATSLTEWTAGAELDGLVMRASLEARHVPVRAPALSLSMGAAAAETDVREFEGAQITHVREVERVGAWVSADWRSMARGLHGAAIVRAEHIATEDGVRGYAIGPAVRIETLPTAGRVVGTPSRLVAEMRMGDVRYRRLQLVGSGDVAHGLAQFAFAAAVDVTGGEPPLDALPSLGHEGSVPGLRWGRHRGAVRVVAGPDAAYPVFPMNGFIRLRVRTGFTGDHLDEAWSGGRWTTGAEVAALWTTPLGSALVGVAGTLRRDWRFTVALVAR